MLYIRSVLFAVLITIWTILCGGIGAITFISLSPKIISLVSYTWASVIIYMLRYICGIRIELQGWGLLPDKPFIIASKHQSVFETIYFLALFKDPAFILKKELTYIPIYGWYILLIDMICIDRSKKISSLTQIIKGIKRASSRKRVIIIFPEGTRVSPGQKVKYKSGIAAINKQLPTIPIVPIALNSGIVWPKHSWLIKPGTITVKILPTIDPYAKQNLVQELQTKIDIESDRL